ncbi:MAG: hypothetical protein GXP48_06000 [Acidobacteria bacterium]|nr:hypothetical protein [Acidobacteriota bacterium]
MSDEMPENIRKLFLTFKHAIEAERAAQATYLQAKKLTDDPALAGILEGFYQDEVRHERILMDRYKILRRKFNTETE